MKKKITLVITCVVLVAAIAVGGTLAWFTDKADVTNVVTFGNVTISLTEPDFDALTSNTKTLDNAQPGDVITKDPTITNTGSNPVWVRAKIVTTLPANAPATDDSVLYDIDLYDATTNPDGKWVKNGDYYYYTEKLENADTAVLFNNVTIPGAEWDNDISFDELEVQVFAEAVQADNNGDTYDAAAWPATVKEAVSST